jgi:hypothetical protein
VGSLLRRFHRRKNNMADRYIEVPEDITIMGNGKPITIMVQSEDGMAGTQQEVKFSFQQFVRHLLDDQDKFGGSAVKLRAAVRIEAAIETIKAGDVLVLKEDDWRVLHQVADEPKHGYPVLMYGQHQIPIARQLLPYIDVLHEPRNTAPEKKAEVTPN